jgi:hypothetical protein
VFDLDAGAVTVMPGDVDDDDGAPPYPVLLTITEGPSSGPQDSQISRTNQKRSGHWAEPRGVPFNLGIAAAARR